MGQCVRLDVGNSLLLLQASDAGHLGNASSGARFVLRFDDTLIDVGDGRLCTCWDLTSLAHFFHSLYFAYRS